MRSVQKYCRHISPSTLHHAPALSMTKPSSSIVVSSSLSSKSRSLTSSSSWAVEPLCGLMLGLGEEMYVDGVSIAYESDIEQNRTDTLYEITPAAS